MNKSKRIFSYKYFFSRYNMKSRGFKVNEKIVNQVLENVNYKQSGCKRVYAKVSLVENKLEINV